MRDIRQGLGLGPPLPMMLPGRKLYRLLNLRRVIHGLSIKRNGNGRSGVTERPRLVAEAVLEVIELGVAGLPRTDGDLLGPEPSTTDGDEERVVLEAIDGEADPGDYRGSLSTVA